MSQSRIIGQVKWFNHKSGYGFISVVSETEMPDVFVHHSEIFTNEDTQIRLFGAGLQAGDTIAFTESMDVSTEKKDMHKHTHKHTNTQKRTHTHTYTHVHTLTQL